MSIIQNFTKKIAAVAVAAAALSAAARCRRSPSA